MYNNKQKMSLTSAILLKNHNKMNRLSKVSKLFGAFGNIVLQGGRFVKPIRADGKVILITGANTGIGKETIRELAYRGGIIYMACRDLAKCEEAKKEIVDQTKNKNIFCRECDLASLESIRRFTENFRKEQNRLDILINNAGIMRCPKQLTKDGFEMQLGVNHLGHFLLTNLLLELVKKSAPSRIINVSSLGHVIGEINTDDLNSEKSYDRGRAYNQSKLANILFTLELAQRLNGTRVTVNALHPGVVHTELGRHMDQHFSISGALVRTVLAPFYKDTVAGAQTTLFAALDDELENVTGKYFSDCKIKDVATAGKDKIMAQWLWDISEKWTGLQKN